MTGQLDRVYSRRVLNCLGHFSLKRQTSKLWPKITLKFHRCIFKKSSRQRIYKDFKCNYLLVDM